MSDRKDERRGPAASEYSDEEAARRRDTVVKRMLNTPPQPRRKAVRDIESPTADILAELASLSASSVNARACLREFLDTKPVIAALKVDERATMRAGHTVYYDEPSQVLVDALAAIRVAAKDTEGDSAGGIHGGAPPRRSRSPKIE